MSISATSGWSVTATALISGCPVSHRTEWQQLPFGRDENPAESYDDWSGQESELPRPTAAELRKARLPRGFRTPALFHHQRRAAHTAPGHRPGRDAGVG